MRSSRFALAAGCGVLLLASGAAQAGGGCYGDCYEKVTHPPAYETVEDLYVARGPKVVARHIPAQVERVSEPVVIRPARTVAKVVPAVYGVEEESYVVSHGRREWQVTVDAHGRKIGCWVDVPPVYGTRHRKVMVRPEQVTYVTIPEKVGVFTRDVVTAPARVVKEYQPPIYETRTRTVQVAPARSEWVPIGGHAAPTPRHVEVHASYDREVMMPRRSGGYSRVSSNSAWWTQ